MSDSLSSRLMHAWNIFRRKELEPVQNYEHGLSSSYRPDRHRFTFANERTILASILTRLSIDTASVDIRHVRVDDNERFVERIKSGLDYCLNHEANIDQTAFSFRMDMAMTLFEKGEIAIIPINTDLAPMSHGGYKIKDVRIADILEWYPKHIRVRCYNEETGEEEELIVPKKIAAIVENPLYSVMNEPNSTLQRLIAKLSLLDVVDEQTSSGKLDIIMQLPYVIKTDARRAEAEKRRKDIEVQLKGSQYGIAYVDGTERITQLNRPSENNLLRQVEYLTNMLYSQLGLTPGIFDGTAPEDQMLNYHTRTIAPVLQAITESMQRTFLTKTAVTQNQRVKFFRDPFKLTPITGIAELADKFTRNEIATSNEFRGIIGWAPSEDPVADELRNKNIPKPEGGEGEAGASSEGGSGEKEAYQMMEQLLSDLDAQIDAALGGDKDANNG